MRGEGCGVERLGVVCGVGETDRTGMRLVVVVVADWPGQAGTACSTRHSLPPQLSAHSTLPHTLTQNNTSSSDLPVRETTKVSL